MLELKNSKTTRTDAKSFSLDGFISPVQMKEPEGQWEDIKPYLVRGNDGWHIEGAPYYAEVKDDGTRLFCPDKHERSKYMRLAMPLIASLEKYVISNPTLLDGQILPNSILMFAPWGKIQFIFTNTALRFEVLFNEAPSFHLLPWTKRETFIFDVESSGLDISKLLTEEHGLGIPRPRLIEVDIDPSIAKEQWLDWSYNAGQLELGFDLAGLQFPILLKNTTIDVNVGATANDGYSRSDGGFWPATSDMAIGYLNYVYNAWYRFTGMTIPQGSTINTAYISTYEYASTANAKTKIYADDQNNPSAPSNQSDHAGRTRTTAGIDWDGDPGAAGYHDSPSIIDVAQELVNSYDYSNEAIQILHDDDGSANGQYQDFNAYDASPSRPPKLHVEYETTMGAARGWWSK